MLTEEQQKRVEKLYKIYIDEIKPLTFYVERRFHKFPMSLLKEYRDVFDHISRLYQDEEQLEEGISNDYNEGIRYIEVGENEKIEDAIKAEIIEYKEDNLKKAENHFSRIRLDIFKYVSDYKCREFEKWKKKYTKYDLERIDNEEFWKGILEQEQKGEDLFEKAREIEPRSIDSAINLMQDSLELYENILQTLNSDETKRKILGVKRKYIRVSFTNFAIGFFAGTLGSLIASAIWQWFQGL